MDGFEVRQLIVIGIHTDTEEQPRVSSVHDLGTPPELDKVRLVFLISWGDKAMDLGGCELVCGWAGNVGAAAQTSPFSFTFSSSYSQY